MDFRRREILAALGLAPLAAKADAAPAADTGDGMALAARIREGGLTAEHAAADAVAARDRMQPHLNFLAAPGFVPSLSGRPFSGVPILVKDLLDVEGLPTRYGSRAYDGGAASGQSPYIDALRNAGFAIIGKCTTSEFGFLPTSEALGPGPTRNPWDPDRSTGGSSGGAAAAVAAGVVPIAHGGDGGGSIRIPAACCGLFGLKPSRGRLIRVAPPPPRPVELGVQHVLTRSVRDSAMVFALTEDASANTPIGFVSGASARPLRIGFVEESMENIMPSDAVRAAFDASLQLLASLGLKPLQTRWPVKRGVMHDFLTYWAEGAMMQAGVTPQPDLLEPFTLALAEHARRMSPAKRQEAADGLIAASAAYNGWFDDFDIIATPVLRTAAPPLGHLAPTVPFDTLYERLIEFAGYTPIHNAAGAPAMSVPLGRSPDGLPIGIQFAAAPGRDDLLFDLAYRLEAKQPWAGRRPPVHA